MTFYDELLSSGREDTSAVVRVQRGADRAVVTLDEPAKLNVLTAPLVQQLKAALEELLADRAIRTIVLTGADPGFSAGGDLRMMVERGLLVGEGETRGRIYRASEKLNEIYLRNYEPRSNVDPFTQEALPFPSEGVKV